MRWKRDNFLRGRFLGNTPWPVGHHMDMKYAEAGRECRGRRSCILSSVEGPSAGGLGVSPNPPFQGGGGGASRERGVADAGIFTHRRDFQTNPNLTLPLRVISLTLESTAGSAGCGWGTKPW